MFLLDIRVGYRIQNSRIKGTSHIWCRDRVFFTYTIEEEEPIFLKSTSVVVFIVKKSMSQSIDQSDTFCFDCVYMYHYTVPSCLHTICHSCFRRAIALKNRLQQETFICPRCPDPEILQKRLRMMAEKNHIREQHKVESVSRKQLSPLQLILKYDCRNIVPRIDECIQDITDLNERKRVQKSLWKNWFLFIEPVETKKVEKILRRQRTQYEYHRQRELFIGNDYLEKLLIQQQVEEEQECDGLDQQPQHIRESLCTERSRPAVNCNIQAKSDSFWPDGTESWHIHEIRPQRQSFVNRIDPEPSIITQEILVKRENHPVDRAQQLNQNLPATVLKVDQILVPPEAPTPYLHDIVDVDICLKKSLPFPDTVIVWNILKLQPYRCALKLYDLSNGLLRSSHAVLHLPSKTQPCTQLSRLINVRFALLLLFLFTVLTRFGIVHNSSHLLGSVSAQYVMFELLFIVGMIRSICLNHPRHSKPYVKTIETLRKLESLLIYPVT
jgi:hypothetical protein